MSYTDYWGNIENRVREVIFLKMDIELKQYQIELLLMYHTGIRISEVNNIDTTDLEHNGTIKIEATKESEDRIISILALEGFDQYKASEIKYILNITTASKIKKRIKTFIKPVNDFYESRNLSTHIFRYLFIYRLLQDGYTTVQIQQEIGHKEIETTRGYINKITNVGNGNTPP